MPEFGLGVYDVVVFLSPFLLLYLWKRWRNLSFSVGASGVIVLGVLCILSQRVNPRYGLLYEGTAAVAVGSLYIIAGLFYLAMERKRTRRRDKRTDGDEK